MKLVSLLRKFLGDRYGATGIEYALIGGIVSICIVASLLGFASTLNDTFTAVSNGFQTN